MINFSSIKGLIEKLVIEIDIIIRETDRITNWEKTLQEYNKRLHAQSIEQTDKQIKFTLQIRNLEQEKEFVKIALAKTANQQIEAQRLDEKRQSLIAKEGELQKISLRIDTRLEELKTLEEKEQLLEK